MDLKTWPYLPFKKSHRTKPNRKDKGRDGGGKTHDERAVWFARLLPDGTEVRCDVPRGKKIRKPWAKAV
jgi:hypothetical protein